MRYFTFVAALIASLIVSAAAEDTVIDDATIQYKYTFQTIKSRGFNFPAHRNLRVSEGVENLLR